MRENPVRGINVRAADLVRDDVLKILEGPQLNVINVHVPRQGREQVKRRARQRPGDREGCPVGSWVGNNRVRRFGSVIVTGLGNAIHVQLLVNVSLRPDARDALQFIRRRPIREPVQDRGGQHGVAAERGDAHAIEFTRRRGIWVSPFIRKVGDGDHHGTVGGVIRDRRVAGDVGREGEIGVHREGGTGVRRAVKGVRLGRGIGREVQGFHGARRGEAFNDRWRGIGGAEDLGGRQTYDDWEKQKEYSPGIHTISADNTHRA